MNCPECEGAIFIYRELSDSEKQEINEHMATCASCRKLFNEVESINQLVAKVSQTGKQSGHSVSLTDKIMAEISKKEKTGKVVSLQHGSTGFSVTRYSLAAVSAAMLIMFFIEVFASVSEPPTIQGPIYRLQSAVLNSDELRKKFSTRKERKRSLLAECVNPLSKQTDQACLKEKLKKLNF